MPKPEPTVPKKLKRPRGLLASRKAGESSTEPEPASKKARAEGSQNPNQVKFEDWQDLEELFENALDALYGSNWTSAIPLVRGVLHECTRLVSVHKDPTTIYSPLDRGDKGKDVNGTPASAFYTIYASAWFLMSTFARNDASLLAQGEPTEPSEYILSSLAACEKGQEALEARKQPKAWDLELTWGRALVSAAQSLVNPEDDAQATTADQNEIAGARARYTGPNASTALDRAFEHLSYATKHRPTGLTNDETEQERGTRDERFTRVLLETTQEMLAITEQLQEITEFSENVSHLDNARTLFVEVEQFSNVPAETRTQAIFGAAQAGLAIGSAMAERLEDEEQDSDVEETKGSSALRKSAIRNLKEVIERFDMVREMSSAKENHKGSPIDDDEIKPLLQEALVTLATLLPEGSEQEAMYARYRDEDGALEEDSDNEE
ncbi:hypothetical protein CTheo_7007 [Ceratobasidium theobromae]|uniref:Uncharacterized protein n=1 Tax=Ceratobasidium theobromae TaxID=1582974 RepID=A0A5N5QCQ1_9AGAM|nr:hypothetical protein CTheo_7007 [Ceratobasidium theobromae]